uniref:Heterogeneous nuclear ribonucleoprotein H-like n=1 Tax=Crassostrea virginica TaxID=6565 RepID=A0A8B8E4C9_CRAVI|nr:heterogeneous nuclear ribonucleoprotein H-like [Crassostrea virginica]
MSLIRTGSACFFRQPQRLLQGWICRTQGLHWKGTSIPETTSDSAGTDGDEVCGVKLRGLPYSATNEDVRKFLKGVNVVGDLHFVDSRDGKPSGICYLKIKAEDKRKAQRLHLDTIGSRYIEVFLMPSSEIDEIPSSGTPSSKDSVNTIVKIRGLPYSYTRQDIIDFFDGLEIVPHGITIPINQPGGFLGQALIQFVSPDIAKQALLRNRHYIGNRYIEVFPSFKVGAFDVSRRCDYGHSVFMRGTPTDVKKTDLEQFFLPLRPMKIHTFYRSGRQLENYAVAEFRSHSEAVEAMERDMQTLKDSPVELYLHSREENNTK